jgi:hypothetical protein
MMKKLAVTVFVASLAAIGCGSDSGTPVKKDGGTDAKIVLDVQGADLQQGAEAQLPQPDAPVGPEVQVDKPAPLDSGVDENPKTDTQVDVQGGEVQKPLDVAKPDVIDAPKPIDLPPGEAGTLVDSGTDTGSID